MIQLNLFLRFIMRLVVPFIVVLLSSHFGLASSVSCKDFFTKSAFVNKYQTEYLDFLRSQALTQAEMASIAHQEDLLRMSLNSPLVAAGLKRAQVHVEPMIQGMLDSDVGKIESLRKTLLLTPSATADKNIRILQGLDESPAGIALRDFLKKNNFPSPAALLPPRLSLQAIRAVFVEVPMLNSFLHEIFGLAFAFRNFNEGLLSLSEFELRVQANLFHNGPEAGFWGTFTRSIVPAALARSKNIRTREFFKGTVFEGPQVDGVVQPRYPAPLGLEGGFHTFIDRMSQATGGGIIKIFHEVAQRAGKTKYQESTLQEIQGLKEIAGLLLNNSAATILQIAKLEQIVSASTSLLPGQKKVFQRVCSAGILRLNKQEVFFKKRIQLVMAQNELIGIEINLTPPSSGPPSLWRNRSDLNLSLDLNSSIETGLAALKALIELEEHENGDPMTEVSSS